MVAHCKELIEYQNRYVAMSRHNKLNTALRTAVEDKEATSHDDLFDSFRLSLSSGTSSKCPSLLCLAVTDNE